jgi:hypothetical protein
MAFLKLIPVRLHKTHHVVQVSLHTEECIATKPVVICLGSAFWCVSVAGFTHDLTKVIN